MSPNSSIPSLGLSLLLGFAGLNSACAADDAKASVELGPVWNVWLENDLIVQTDRHYTHGSRIAFLGGEHRLDSDKLRWDGRFARWLPDLWMSPSVWRSGMSITQNIYTPRDIDIATIIQDERPYAGWLFATLTLMKRGTIGSTPVLDAWSVNLGVVGPAALGEEAQNSIHRVRSIDLAMGWDNQLKNEPAVGIRYARTLRYEVPMGAQFSSQLLPFAGIQLDTVQTYASIGAQWRVGLNLPGDFGWRSIDDVVPATGGRPRDGSGRRGVYFFLGIEGRGYVHNMLVEGSLYHDTHSVDIQRFLGEFKMGIGYSGKRWDLTFTHMVRSKEFKQQQDIDSFGSISVAFKW